MLTLCVQRDLDEYTLVLGYMVPLFRNTDTTHIGDMHIWIIIYFLFLFASLGRHQTQYTIKTIT